MLNPEQKRAFDAIRDGTSILLTGPAGTGKTYTLNEIRKWADQSGISIGVTSTTGTSAILIGGRTIHSFLGIGLADKPASVLADEVMEKPKQLVKRLRFLDILILDEVSMMDADLFDKVSDFLGIIRGNGLPFGGIQLVLTGDFCQIPPVKGRYCFTSEKWKLLELDIVHLETPVRQTDPEFQRILSELRYGQCSKETLARLKQLTETKFSEGIVPTKLFAKNVDVDAINNEAANKLKKAGAVCKIYKTNYSAVNDVASKAWAKSVKIPEEVEVIVGSQVVLTWNVDVESGLANGSRGVVTGITPAGPEVKFNNAGKVIVSFVDLTPDHDKKIKVSYVPLKLAYAITIHRAQGMTLDAVEMDLGTSIFEYGQGYTAISRVRDLASVKITNIAAKSFRTHPDVIAFYKSLRTDDD